MLDLTTLVDLVSRGGLLTALLLALVGGMRGWYICKGAHDSIVQGLTERLNATTVDRDFWRDQAIKALTVANKSVTIAKTTTESSQQ
jgi:hypothetical protein